MEKDSNEQEPVMRLSTSEGKFEATRQNTSLFRFFGKLAIYDHVFFVINEETMTAMYVFNSNPVFDTIAQYMTENDYPVHLNIQEVSQCDLDAYDQMIANDVNEDLNGGIPEDWN